MKLTFNQTKLLTNDAFRLCTGDVGASGDFSVAELLDLPDDARLGLILQWVGSPEEKFSGVSKEDDNSTLSLTDLIHFPDEHETQSRFSFEVRSTNGPVFDNTPEKCREALAEVGMEDHLAETFDDATLQHIGAGVVNASDRLHLEMTIKSDNCRLMSVVSSLLSEVAEDNEKTARFPRTPPDFYRSPFQFIAKLDAGKMVVRLSLLFRMQYHNSQGAPELHKDLKIQFRNLAFLEQFEGFAAIDVGNTASTFAVTAPGQAAERDPVLVQIHPSVGTAAKDDDKEKLPSSVFFEKIFERSDGDKAPFQKSEHVCGSEANNKAHEELCFRNLVVSPKRYLERSSSDKMEILGSQVSRHLPLRNLIADILKQAQSAKNLKFHEALPGFHLLPGMTLTYPTTFVGPEIDRLERVYRDAVRYASQASHCPGVKEPKIAPPTMLDEATAAAFYFLDRDFFDASSRVSGFCYLFPNGANILVFDFGGGTTDIALVRCEGRIGKQDSDGNALRDQMEIQVLGRTGMRRFGGDTITAAFFRVIKATLFAHLAEKGSLQQLRSEDEQIPAADGEAKNIETEFGRWYRSKLHEIDDKIRTRTSISEGPGSAAIEIELPNTEREDRRRLATQLWNYARRAKHWLSDNSEVKDRQADEFPIPEDVESSLFKLLPNDRWEEIRSELSSSDCLDLIHEQVMPHLDQLIKKANHLVASKLTQPDSLHLPFELQRAYIAGQAACFPLIRERIEKELHLEKIQSLGKSETGQRRSTSDHRRLVFDRGELKDAVVKGALLFNVLKHQAAGIDFIRDEDLREKLPFDIVYDDMLKNLGVVFPEGTQLKTLINRPQRIEYTFPESTPDKPRHEQFWFLYRRWPGEKTAEPFFKFNVPARYVGNAWVDYVTRGDSYGFNLLIGTDEDPKTITGEWMLGLDYEAPLQRGDL